MYIRWNCFGLEAVLLSRLMIEPLLQCFPLEMGLCTPVPLGGIRRLIPGFNTPGKRFTLISVWTLDTYIGQ